MHERREMLGPGLGPRMENRIAASHVGFDRMLRANTIAQFQIMSVAGPAAVSVIRPLGEKGAKNTMLHMEHQDVLMNRNFNPIGRGGLQ